MAEHPGARFSKTAELYDLIYTFKDYAAEAAIVRQVLHDEGIPDGSTVLEGACGTGAYLGPLSAWFQVSGFDLDADSLVVARRKVPPTSNIFKANLLDFRVKTPVDAAIVLFGGLAYLHPTPRLEQACGALFRAVRPGGVAIVEPWLTPDDVARHSVHMHVFEAPHLKVCRQVAPELKGDLLVLDFHFLVARPGFPVEHKTERNELFLYPRGAVADALRVAGFVVRELERGFLDGSRLLVARRPPSPA